MSPECKLAQSTLANCYLNLQVYDWTSIESC